MVHKIKLLLSILGSAIFRPVAFIRYAKLFPEFMRGLAVEKLYKALPVNEPLPTKAYLPVNPLWEYFSNHKAGPGLWKWNHYFDAYHRHFAPFRNQDVNILEIGIYSGGSLGMWQQYFGEHCHIYGVDIEEACKSYESEKISVFIGDQQDRDFWANFRSKAPAIQILIDDGGHTPEQQMVTLEEMLPHMPAGSVYVCEDIHGISNQFTAFATAMVHSLNASSNGISSGELGFISTPAQQAIHSIHFYPYLCVIEKHESPPEALTAPKHGTEWQPFLGDRWNASEEYKN